MSDVGSSYGGVTELLVMHLSAVEESAAGSRRLRWRRHHHSSGDDFPYGARHKSRSENFITV